MTDKPATVLPNPGSHSSTEPVNAAPTISVLMSAYNAEKYLSDAVESILNQTFRDFEFVIVNDGSTDATSRILNQYAQKDDRIVLIEQDNSGLCRALNVGLFSCRGELVARMDADDIAVPQRFEKQVEFLHSNPECVAVGTGLALIDSDGDILGTQVPPLTHDEIEASLFKGVGAVPHPTAMIRRTFLDQIGGYDETAIHVEDLDLWLRLSELGRLANMSNELLRYRLHENSVTVTKRRIQIENAAIVLKSACERRGIQMDLSSVLQSELEDFNTSGLNQAHQLLAMAVHSGNYGTASKYAWRRVRNSPFSLRRWKTWLALAFGRRPKRI